MDVIEEATALLRNLSARAWFAFYAPSIPFVLCLLLFWSEMSRAPDATHRLVPGALLLTVMYVVMKCGHAVFGDLLLSLLRRDPAPPPRFRPTQWLKLAASQAFLHSTMPWILFLCSFPVFPLAWAYAFYRNAGILACGHFRSHGSVSTLIGRSLRAAHHAPRSNHAVLLTLSLVGLLVWLNAMILAIFIPQLAGILTGVDFDMNHSPLAMFNTTLFAAATATAWLVVSPIFHAAYAVRCFEADSTKSGEDLLSALRSLRPTASALIALACLLLPVAPTHAAEPPPATPTLEQVAGLDRALDDTLNEAEFRWRMPRESLPEEQLGWLERTMRDFTNWLSETIQSISQWIGDFLRWLFENDDKTQHSPDSSGGWLSDPANARVVLILLLVGLGIALAILVIRWFLSRRAAATVQAASLPSIDLHDESILATDLPEDEWLRLANERLAAGDTRLALRALFLGILARLGSNGLLAIAPGKTNGMYQRELNRRPHANDTLRSAFSHSVRLFERCWYGTHTATPTIVEEARSQHRTICQDVRTENT
jgi:hypothetical protein